jgi:hypothetical protein
VTREATLAIISTESEKAHRALLERKEKGDLFYEPRPESAYVWELETDREHVGMGYRDRHKHTTLFVTRGLAFQAACEEILRYYGDGYWSEEYREKLKTQMADGKHEEAAMEWSSRHGALRFTVRSIEVRASAEPYKTL